MSSPSQSYTHELNPVSVWPNPYALMKIGQQLASTTVNTQTAFAGMVGHLYPTAGVDLGKLALGCPRPAVTTGIAPVGMFLFQSQNDFDAVGDDGNLVGAPATGGTANVAKINCLVSTGGYELETTEFINASIQTGSPLTGVNSGANLGKLQSYANETPGTNKVTLVGVVSDGVITNDISLSGPSRLRFLSCYIPGYNM